MRPIRWLSGNANPLRGFTARVHRRTEHLPRLPFGVALGAAILLLVVAIETGPDPDAAVTEVDELSLLDRNGEFQSRESEYSTVPASLEIVEFGFGRVTDPQGVERLGLGAVIRNPQDSIVMPSTLAVTGTDEDGTTFTLERVYLDFIPAGASVPVGYILLEQAGDIDESTLGLVTEDVYMWDPPAGTSSAGSNLYSIEERSRGRAEIDMVDVEPLFSPEGYRITYRVEAAEDFGYQETLKIAIVFRDGDGAIVGGMPGWGDPFGAVGDMVGYRSVPPGVSIQYLDLPLEYIPEGADLNRIEIGPGV